MKTVTVSDADPVSCGQTHGSEFCRKCHNVKMLDEFERVRASFDRLGEAMRKAAAEVQQYFKSIEIHARLQRTAKALESDPKPTPRYCPPPSYAQQRQPVRARATGLGFNPVQSIRRP